MIKKHSDDPNVEQAAQEASAIISKLLSDLPEATTYDYGGHDLTIGEYGVCTQCTKPIAEAQQAASTLRVAADIMDDAVVREHLELAARLFEIEAEAAVIRAEFHNGHGTERILNSLLGYQYERKIQEEYQHSHHAGN